MRRPHRVQQQGRGVHADLGRGHVAGLERLPPRFGGTQRHCPGAVLAQQPLLPRPLDVACPRWRRGTGGTTRCAEPSPNRCRCATAAACRTSTTRRPRERSARTAAPAGTDRTAPSSGRHHRADAEDQEPDDHQDDDSGAAARTASSAAVSTSPTGRSWPAAWYAPIATPMRSACRTCRASARHDRSAWCR